MILHSPRYFFAGQGLVGGIIAHFATKAIMADRSERGATADASAVGGPTHCSPASSEPETMRRTQGDSPIPRRVCEPGNAAGEAAPKPQEKRHD